MSANRPEQLCALTGARFFAAVGVLLFHINFSFGADDGKTLAERYLQRVPAGAEVVDRFTGLGSLGVNFFFVLSGFILTYNYRSFDRGHRGAHKFYWARFARIYPMYAVALMMTLLFRASYGSQLCVDEVCQQGDRTVVGASSALLLQAWLPWVGDAYNGPGWTLSAEAFFYTLFPLVIVFCARLKVEHLVAGLIAALLATQVGPAILWLADPSSSSVRIWLQFSPIIRLPEFLAGVFACRLLLKLPGRMRPMRRLQSDVLAIACLVVLAFLGEVILRMDIDPITVNDGLLDGVFVVLIVALAIGTGMLQRILSTPTAQILGESSYALYILHWPLWLWFSQFIVGDKPPSALTMSAYFVSTVAAAICGWLLVERPARRWILAKTGSRASPARSERFEVIHDDNA